MKFGAIYPHQKIGTDPVVIRGPVSSCCLSVRWHWLPNRLPRSIYCLGVDVEAIVYDGAGHAWENTQPQFFSEQSPYIEGLRVELR